MKNLLAAIAVCAALPCFAQNPEEPKPLEPVVVIGTRSEQTENRLPAIVTVITREQIERSGASHIVEVLRTAGALQVTDLYGDGSRATVDLRGFGDAAGSTTLILVDGRRLNNPDIAPPDLNSISLKDVERIEILSGSGGTLYGDQAVGGVINIVTRAPRGFSASAGAQAGSYNAYGARASLGERWSAASLRLSAEDRRSDNYREHNALENKNVLARAGFDGADGGMFVEGSYVFEDLETPGPLFASDVAQDRRQSTTAFHNDYSDTNTGFVRVNVHQRLGDRWKLDTDFDHRRSNGDFRLSFASGFSSPGTQVRETRAAHPRLVGTFGETLVTLGADGQIADYTLDSAAFGAQTNKQRQGDLYAQSVLPLPAQLELTTGARFSRVENEVQDQVNFPDKTRFHDTQPAAELGLAWRASETLKLFARYDHNYRYAKVDEFTLAAANPPACAPAPDTVYLDTQTGNSYEIGSEWAAGIARVRASAYRLELHDEIAFDPLTCFGSNINLDRTRRDGVLLETSLALGEAWSLEAAAHHLDSEITGGMLTGHEIPLVSRNTAKLALGGRLPAGFTAHLEGQAAGKRPLAGDFDNSLEKLPGFAVVNAGLGWMHGALGLEARINNLLDHAYAEYGASAFDAGFNEAAAFFPSPERNFRLTLDYHW